MIELSKKDVDNIRYAVLLQAIKDYAGLLLNKRKTCKSCKIDELKSFFSSDWFQFLYDYDGNYFTSLVEKEVEQCKKTGKRFILPEYIQ